MTFLLILQWLFVPFLWHQHDHSYRYLKWQEEHLWIIMTTRFLMFFLHRTMRVLTIHVKGHIQFFTDITMRCDRNSNEKFDEIFGRRSDKIRKTNDDKITDFSWIISIKCFKDMRTEFICFSRWIKLFVNFDEFFLV